MQPFDPMRHVENAAAIAVDGRWPNFHDAEIDRLSFTTGDVRPEEDIWTGAALRVQLTLHAERAPPVVELRFRDCTEIRFAVAGTQNDILDLGFAFEDRGMLRDGVTPLSPFIRVVFAPNAGPVEAALSFRCFGVEASLIDRLPARG